MKPILYCTALCDTCEDFTPHVYAGTAENKTSGNVHAIYECEHCEMTFIESKSL